MGLRTDTVHNFLAVDIGAGSGRVVLGALKNSRLSTREIHRFPNAMLEINGHLHWDVHALFNGIKHAMKSCAHEKLYGIAVDTWGVDFGLFGPDGTMLCLPFAYRDRRTIGIMEKFFTKIPRKEIYRLTGIQFLPFNTLYQLYSMAVTGSPLLERAKNLLFMPDILNYFLTGVMRSEFTFATTSQLFNPHVKRWEPKLFKAAGVSREIMNRIAMPGTEIGRLLPKICRETGLKRLSVTAVASHDTGSAVAAVPAQDKDWAYISSGTWSLMGIETGSPLITEKALKYNFTNEGGVGGTYRFLKNIAGLWLLQECMKAWAKGKKYDYDGLLKAAEHAKPFRSIIDPDYKGFLSPPDMPSAIAGFCKATAQPAPRTPAEFTRCIIESLALKYRFVFEQLKDMAPNPVNRIHVIGGGSMNGLLCRFTADACGVPVIAGPAEATAAGNIMVQAMACGEVDSLKDIREIIRNSFTLKTYKPADTCGWEKAFGVMAKIQDICAHGEKYEKK